MAIVTSYAIDFSNTTGRDMVHFFTSDYAQLQRTRPRLQQKNLMYMYLFSNLRKREYSDISIVFFD